MMPKVVTSAGARRLVRLCTAVVLATTIASCDLDLENPNAPTEEEIVSSRDGIIAVAVGMQGQFAQSIDDWLVTSSLATDEWGTRSIALISYISLFTGDNFDVAYDVVLQPYARTYQVVNSANIVLEGVRTLTLGVGLEAGLGAVANLFKAMALGFAYQQYEELAVDVDPAGAPTVPRAQVLDSVIVLLERARAAYGSVSAADLTEFNARALGPGINLANTVDAMLARYYLFDGRYAEAITAADRVDQGVISELRYPAPTVNPVRNLAFGLNYVGGLLRGFARQAQPGDARVQYWVDTLAATQAANPPDTLLKPLKKYSGVNEPFPLYFPDEMKLIKAEALARQGGAANFAAAAALVNEVRTDNVAQVDEPTAALAPLLPTELDTEAELLDAIAYERRYELYEQGLRWEDTRRLGTARTTTPTFEFLPLPRQECVTNPVACG
jgi:starch-binding outer membrane protein, SusD/RagB family